jgi:hypothetical protein
MASFSFSASTHAAAREGNGEKGGARWSASLNGYNPKRMMDLGQPWHRRCFVDSSIQFVHLYKLLRGRKYHDAG